MMYLGMAFGDLDLHNFTPEEDVPEDFLAKVMMQARANTSVAFLVRPVWLDELSH